MRIEPLFSRLGTAALIALCCQCAWALSSDPEQDVEIEADRGTLDGRSNTSTYTGNVQLIQGSIQINAELLTVKSENGRVQVMLISGTAQRPARFRQQTDNGELAEGKAEHIEYRANLGQLVLLGNAELNQGSNHIRSQRIDYNTQTNSLIAGGSASGGSNGSPSSAERVKMIIKPQANSPEGQK